MRGRIMRPIPTPRLFSTCFLSASASLTSAWDADFFFPRLPQITNIRSHICVRIMMDRSSRLKNGRNAFAPHEDGSEGGPSRGSFGRPPATAVGAG